MRTTTYIGLILGVGTVYLAVRIKGGDLSLFTNYPALLVCVGGTFAAITLSSSRMTILHVFSAISKLLWSRGITSHEAAGQILELARQARARGAASIDPDAIAMLHDAAAKADATVSSAVPPETGGITAIRSPSERGSDGSAYVSLRARREIERISRRAGNFAPSRRGRSPTVAPSGTTISTSARPAISLARA